MMMIMPTRNGATMVKRLWVVLCCLVAMMVSPTRAFVVPIIKRQQQGQPRPFLADKVFFSSGVATISSSSQQSIATATTAATRTTLWAKRVPRTARTTGTTSAGPKGAGARRQRPSSSNTIKRAPHQFDHTKEQARPFVDVLAEIANQKDNEEAPAFALPCDDDDDDTKEMIRHPHFRTYSLDELFPNCGFSETFASSAEFRTELRNSMREDIFDTTPTYHGMSAKARQVLLLPDSSLQG